MKEQLVERMTLSEKDAVEVQKAVDSEEAGEFLHPERLRANIVGLGSGVKWSDGEPTGKPAVVVLVTQKVEMNEEDPNCVPEKLAGMQTDVLTVGYPVAGGGAPLAAGSQTLAEKVRPVEGGYSVGHVKITAGTVATCVYDILPGGGVKIPRSGIGVPSHYYVLSNNHVLANCNDGRLGDIILQPGRVDGGTDPEDGIARLSRFVPITFYPPVPLWLHRNIVDAAIAEGEFHDLNREIYWIGYVHGWLRKANVRPGLKLQKTGRTTNYTTGRVTVTGATIDVGYGGGKIARFRDQILTTPMSAPGDSGSLLTTYDNVAVGLLFAGSSKVTIANQIENVRGLLRIEVAEEIL